MLQASSIELQAKYLFSVEVLRVERGLQAELEGVDILHAEPFPSDLAVEFACYVYGEIRIHLRAVFRKRVLRILSRKDDDIPVADRDVFLEKVDPAVVLIQRKIISWIEIAYSASIANESLRVIAGSRIDFAVIDSWGIIYVEVVIVSRVESSEFQYLQGIPFFAVSASNGSVVIEISAFYERSSDEDPGFPVLGNKVQFLISRDIFYGARSLHDVFVIIVIPHSKHWIDVVFHVPELPAILAEGLLSGIQASGTVLHLRVMNHSLRRWFIVAWTAEIDLASGRWYLIYIAIVSVCRGEIAISVCSNISYEWFGIVITSDVLPVEVFFVVDGIILQEQIDFLYGEISVLRHIRSRLDVVFELDHPCIDIEYHRQ